MHNSNSERTGHRWDAFGPISQRVHEPRDQNVTFCVSASEKELLKQDAAVLGRTLSSHICALALSSLGRGSSE